MAMMDPKIKRKPVEPGKIEAEVVDISTIINEQGKYKSVANNNNTIKSSVVMSQELHEGMVIQAQDGGNPNKRKVDREH